MTRLFVALTLLVTFCLSHAQPVRGLMAGFNFKHRPADGHVAFVRYEFWCSAPKTVPMAKGATIDFGARGRDFRDLKSVTLIDGPGSPADQEITEFVVMGAPIEAPRITSDDGIKPKIGEDAPTLSAITRLQTPTLIWQKELHVPVQSGKSTTFNITREGMPDEPKLYGHLKVRIKVEDGCRKESRLKLFLETIDGQFLQVPDQAYRDGENKEIDMNLDVPVPENGIRRIHAWFSNYSWLTNNFLGRGDLFQDDDDAKLLVTITGEGSRGNGTLGRASLTLTDWRNAVSRDLSTAPQTYADVYLSNIEVVMQTGPNALNFNPRALPSVKCRVILNRDKDLVRHTSGVFAHNHDGSTFFGEFRDRTMAKGSGKPSRPGEKPLPEGFRLSDVSEVLVTMEEGVPIPADYRDKMSEPWDLNLLLIQGVVLSSGANQPQPLIFANFALNQTLRYNLNVSTGAQRSYRVRMQGTPIKYRATAAPAR